MTNRAAYAVTEERSATPLELLFDLCFVVAVAILAADLHHGVAEGHAGRAVAAYLLLFVPVWWAWMSFTWFATAFDEEDTVHRLLTMAQMVGVIVLAASAHRAAEGDLAWFGVAVVALRVPLVAQWLRAGLRHPDYRAFARTYAGGLTLGAATWFLGTRAELPGALVVLAGAVAVDLATPVAAVRRASGPTFHPGHVAERYGLFTLIVLGESILAMSVAVEAVVNGSGSSSGVSAVVAAGAVAAFGTWWIYFEVLGRDGLTRNRRAAFTWGYGHYLLFAATAAVGAGVQVQVEALEHHPGAPDVAALALPVASVLAAVAWLQVAANRVWGSATPLLVGALACLAVVAGSGRLTLPVADLLLAVVVLAATVVASRARRGER